MPNSRLIEFSTKTLSSIGVAAPPLNTNNVNTNNQHHHHHHYASHSLSAAKQQKDIRHRILKIFSDDNNHRGNSNHEHPQNHHHHAHNLYFDEHHDTNSTTHIPMSRTKKDSIDSLPHTSSTRQISSDPFRSPKQLPSNSMISSHPQLLSNQNSIAAAAPVKAELDLKYLDSLILDELYVHSYPSGMTKTTTDNTPQSMKHAPASSSHSEDFTQHAQQLRQQHSKKVRSLIIKGTNPTSSLLASEQSVSFMQHLRKNRPDFYDTLNRMEYQSHIDSPSAAATAATTTATTQQDLFTNKSPLISLVHEHNNTANNNNTINSPLTPVPKRLNDIYISESTVPMLQLTPQPIDKQSPESLVNIPPQSPVFSPVKQLANGQKHLSHPHLRLHHQYSSSKPAVKRHSSQLSFASTQASLPTLKFKKLSDCVSDRLPEGGSPAAKLETRDIIKQLLTSSTMSSIQQHHSNNHLAKSSVSLNQHGSPSVKFHPEQQAALSKRREAAEVRKWLQEKLEALNSESNLSVKQVFNYFQNVFQASLSEIIRQVSVECKERADLLQEIWDNQVSLSDKIFVALNKEKQHVELTSQQEINKLHKHYQCELQKCFESIDSKSAYITDINKQLSKLQSENKTMRHLGLRLDKNFRIANNQIHQLRLEYRSVFNENIEYAMREQKIIWETAFAQKKAALAEAFNQRTMCNYLIKEGNYSHEKHRGAVPYEDICRKYEVDELIKKFVIDRESNIPVKFLNDHGEIEPFEEDSSHQVPSTGFMESKSTDTADLIKCVSTAINTEKTNTSNCHVQTTSAQVTHATMQTDFEGLSPDDFYTFTDPIYFD